MDSTQFWLRQQLSRLSASCQSAISRISMAQSMSEVVRLADVPVPAELRGVKRSQPEYRMVRSKAEARLRVLLQAQLIALVATATEADCKALLARYRSRDWSALRGEYPALLQVAEREGVRALSKKAGATQTPPAAP